MEILEQQLIGKKNQETCEDAIVVTTHHLAVIDGSTSKTNRSIQPGVRNGRYAMMLASQCIENLPAEATCEDFCQSVTASFAAIYESHHYSEDYITEHPEERLTCSAAVYSIHHREIWMIGDCQCLVDGKLYENPKPMEAANAAKRIAYIRENRLSESSIREHDEGRDHIINDIISSMHLQNKTFSVIDGTPIYMKGVKHIPTRDAHEIVLATDGYPFLHTTLAESEAALQDLLQKDPCCLEIFQATKACMNGQVSFDDRAYLRFNI